jgi:hypothetical protein
VDSINLAQDIDKWLAVLNAVMKISCYIKDREFVGKLRY